MAAEKKMQVIEMAVLSSALVHQCILHENVSLTFYPSEHTAKLSFKIAYWGPYTKPTPGLYKYILGSYWYELAAFVQICRSINLFLMYRLYEWLFVKNYAINLSKSQMGISFDCWGLRIFFLANVHCWRQLIKNKLAGQYLCGRIAQWSNIILDNPGPCHGPAADTFP